MFNTHRATDKPGQVSLKAERIGIFLRCFLYWNFGDVLFAFNNRFQVPHGQAFIGGAFGKTFLGGRVLDLDEKAAVCGAESARPKEGLNVSG